MKKLQLNELDEINGGIYFSPATQQQIANECNEYHIYDPYVYNSNGTLNVSGTTDNALGNCASEGVSSLLTGLYNPYL